MVNDATESLSIRINNLTKIFIDDNNRVDALDNVNLDVLKGKITVLIGPSGCGKSTLLYMMAGFEKPSSGSIYLNDSLITKPAPDRGFVFQDYALFPWKTVLGNVAFGLISIGWEKKKAYKKAREFVSMVNLDGFQDAYPHTLSGGMKQRVAIARALAYNPDVLLMDEPFGALDAQTRKLMQKEVVKIWQKTKKTIVFVTHSVVEAVFLADVIVVMTARPGKVKGVIEVNIDRPRSYVGEDYLQIRENVLSLLEEEVNKQAIISQSNMEERI